MVSNAKEIFEGASQDPTVVGMIGFVWSNTNLCPLADCSQYPGLLVTKALPNLLSTMRCIGHAITGRDSPMNCSL